MKTIKELEKEIGEKEKESNNFINNLFDEELEVKFDLLMEKDILLIELSSLKAKLQTLKDVLEIIDEVVNDLHKTEDKDELQHIAYTEMVLMNDFKNKIMGVNQDNNEVQNG